MSATTQENWRQRSAPRHFPEHRMRMLPSTGTMTGFAWCVYLILRRDWLRLSIWAVVLSGMIVLVYDSQQQSFPTQADRDAYAQVANTPAVAAMTGLPYAAGSLGGILVIKIWMTLAVSIGLAVIFLVTRNGRGDEESGRTELLRSGAVGRHAYSMANYAMAGALGVVTGVLISLLCLAVHLPATGSWIMGASIAGTAVAFVGLAAMCGQVSASSRGANTLGVTLMGLFYLIRAAADLLADGMHPNAFSWFSPLGWAQNMRPFGQDTWWPLAALLTLAVGCCAVALHVEAGRDLGMGLVPERRGPAKAGAFLGSPMILVLRLQRGSVLGWLIGSAVAGLFFGTVSTAMTQALNPASQLAQSFVGDSGQIIDGVLATFAMFSALLAGAFALQVMTGARTEEAAGHLDLQLAAALPRLVWLGAYALVAALGSAVMLLLGGLLMGAFSQGTATGSELVTATMAYWPAVLLMLGVMVFLFGFWPRWCIPLTWAAYGMSLLVAMLGKMLSLPDSVISATPFGAVPQLPADGFTITPLTILTVTAFIFGVLGSRQFYRRDIVSG